MKKNDSRDLAADQDTTGRTVVGMFTNRPDAEAAIRELKAAGFGEDRIGVALQNRDEQRDLMETTGTEAAEGAAKGAVSGGVVGGLIGLLGSLLIPGVGPIVVGGVLASTLTGAGIGAATGGVIGALVGLGVPEDDARHFDEGLRSGRTLVTVDAGSRTGEALAILDRHGMDFGPSGASRYELVDVEIDEDVGEDIDRARIEAIDAGAAGSRPGRAAPGRRYRGRERRVTQDALYAGPERRLAGV
ncbi:MAG TPA: general stress protein [Gemmatimonadales bacterium]|nr:general stress protein [Gemmatimonadales bacterium]